MNTTEWFQNGTDFHLGDLSTKVGKLPAAIYRISFTPQGVPYLTQTGKEFGFQHKLYDVNTDFVNRVYKTYHNVDGNLGILLNGVKGTGKSVTAKVICNTMKLPVIVINHPFGTLPEFLASIPDDVLVFIDEYEKVFKDDAVKDMMLTIMDGALKSLRRRMFVLTTNNLYVNENILARPGRVRYLKEYGDLTPSAVEQIVDDMLHNKAHREDVISAVSTLPIITIDLVKSIVEEVNIHDEVPNNFMEFFNVRDSHGNREVKYNGYRVVDGVVDKSQVVLTANLNGSHGLQRMDRGYNFYNSQGNLVATVDKKLAKTVFLVKRGFVEVLSDAEFDEDGDWKYESDYDKKDVVTIEGKRYLYIHPNFNLNTEWDNKELPKKTIQVEDLVLQFEEVREKHYSYNTAYSSAAF